MIKKWVCATALFVCLLGSFLSMLAWDLTIITALFDAPLGLSGLGNGLLIIFNRLFAISEQQQQYRYVMFHISSPLGDWNGNVAAAFVLVIFIFAVIGYVMVVTRRRWINVTFILIIVGVQAYFGVFAGVLWNIALFSTLAATLTQNIGEPIFNRSIAITMMFICVITAVVWVVYPGQNMRLNYFSESIRDRFDTPLNPFAVAPHDTHDANAHREPDPLDLNVTEVGDDTLHDAATEQYIIEYDDRAQGAEIGLTALEPSLWLAIILVFSFLFLAMAYRLVPPLWKAKKRRRMFKAEAVDVAINQMFIYLFEWLAVLGLERKNNVFSAYATQLETLVSPQYSKEYLRFTALWQKVMYSDHAIGEAERQRTHDFLQTTMDFVWKKSNAVTKLKIKFQYFL